jgi:cyclophilin family peptidyl-prolyl cis-trans isomerase
MRTLILTAICLMLAGCAGDPAQPVNDTAGTDVPVTADTSTPTVNPQVTLVTTLGSFTIELKVNDAPITTQNFLKYVEEGFYDGDDGSGTTTFHRVISGFMVQGGGLKANQEQKKTHPAIVNESTNGLFNVRGSVAMARTNDPNSATSQFFVNHANNPFLNYAGAEQPGYAVFGEVVEGMSVIDVIAAVQTDVADVPLETIEIIDVIQ